MNLKNNLPLGANVAWIKRINNRLIIFRTLTLNLFRSISSPPPLLFFRQLRLSLTLSLIIQNKLLSPSTEQKRKLHTIARLYINHHHHHHPHHYYYYNSFDSPQRIEKLNTRDRLTESRAKSR